MLTATQELSEVLGTRSACDATGFSRATFHRLCKPKPKQEPSKPKRPRALQPNALTPEQRQEVKAILYSERFCDDSPHQVHAKLLDEGEIFCSVRTMYRLLEQEGAAKPRRNQRAHPHYEKPCVLALGPNQVWTWDVTKLQGPVKWEKYSLFVILDLYSRLVVGWVVVDRETAAIARELIEQSVEQQGVTTERRLVVHSDRGSPQTSKTVAELYSSLGITKSLSRPKVSNDNPYSEAQFKTLKYSRAFPQSFGSLEDAKAFCREFFRWYNEEHRHSGLNMFTPAQVHYGEVEELVRKRQETLDAHYEQHPERYRKGRPVARRPPEKVWINQPTLELFSEGEESKQQDPESSPVSMPAEGLGSGSEGQNSPGEGEVKGQGASTPESEQAAHAEVDIAEGVTSFARRDRGVYRTASRGIACVVEADG